MFVFHVKHERGKKMIKSLLLVNVVMYDGTDAYVRELCVDATYETGKGYKVPTYVKNRVVRYVSTYGMELLKIDTNTYHTVSIDDIMSWNDKNSDADTVRIKKDFVEMFGDKLANFYNDVDYMN